MMFGIERVARKATELLLERVTDLVFNDDGSVDGKGLDQRDVPTTSPGYHFGFYSRPKDGAVGVVVRFLGLSFLAAWRDKQFEMSLEKGEVGLQNAFGANVLLDKNAVVNLNGDDYSLPKWDEFLDDFSTFITNLGTDLAAGSASGVTTTSTTGIADALAEGWKSTKVKNG